MQGHPIVGDLPTSAFVQNSYLFKSLDNEGCKMLCDSAKLQNYKAGETVVTEGDKGDAFYLIKEGEVEVTIDRNGKKVSLSILKRGAFFGEVAVLTQNVRTATVSASQDTSLVVFSQESINVVLKKFPRVKAILQAILVSRAQKTIGNL